MHSNYEAYERNTVVYGNSPSEGYYLTLKIPQYSEQNATHFRVKVEADRQGDDDIWFELVNEDNASKTYTNADFDQLLPIVSPIVQPTRLRIYMKPATSGATLWWNRSVRSVLGNQRPQEPVDGIATNREGFVL